MDGTCEHSHVCGRDAPGEHDNKCILHSEDPDKDEQDFEEALGEHQGEHGPDFRRMVFPADSMPFTDSEISFFSGIDREGVNCRGVTFLNKANFNEATFLGGADFSASTFQKTVSFQRATFMGPARFSQVTFQKSASFEDVEIRGEGDFRRAQFLSEEADFFVATITGKTYFLGAEFERGVNARGAELLGGALITSSDLGESDFRGITVGDGSSLNFREVDLSRCMLTRTDLRRARFTNVEWCTAVSSDGWFLEKWFGRSGIYDEFLKSEGQCKAELLWEDIERAYRQLKVQYEERGDFPRGGDFHIGEKEARSRNPQTRWGMWFLLTVYRTLSKYGERALPAALWLVVLVFGFALVYYLSGATTLATVGPVTYPEAFIHSLEATFYPVQSVGFQNFGPQIFSIVQRVVSPVLIALLALALRQRVKR